MPSLISRNLAFVLQTKPNIVEPIHQTMPGKFVHREPSRKPPPILNHQSIEIHRQLVSLNLPSPPHDLGHLLIAQPHRQQPIFQTVIRKDIRERRGNHHPKPKIRQRPHRMFAR